MRLKKCNRYCRSHTSYKPKLIYNEMCSVNVNNTKTATLMK